MKNKFTDKTDIKAYKKAKQCKTINSCYNYLVHIAQDYCNNRIFSFQLDKYSTFIPVILMNKILNTDQRALFEEILDYSHIYSFNESKKQVKNYASKALSFDNYNGVIEACNILEDYGVHNYFRHEYAPYLIIEDYDNEDEASGIDVFNLNLGSALDMVVELKYALKNHTHNLTEIKENSKKYYFQFMDTFEKYMDNHSDRKIAAFNMQE